MKFEHISDRFITIQLYVIIYITIYYPLPLQIAIPTVPQILQTLVRYGMMTAAAILIYDDGGGRVDVMTPWH